MKRWATLALLLLGCGGPTNLERQADGDLADGRVDAAVAAYQRMAERSPDGRVLAKLGSAALRGGKLGIAVDAFARLGREDPSRRAEAADGLDAAARAAEAERRERREARKRALRNALPRFGVGAHQGIIRRRRRLQNFVLVDLLLVLNIAVWFATDVWSIRILVLIACVLSFPVLKTLLFPR